MEDQDDMPFVCSVADCGMRFINEDHLNWHSKKHEMSLALNTGGHASSSTSNHNFLDQTPTPTKFLKNCEDISLFSELTPNPFDHAYKKALDDPTSALPGPTTSGGGDLNTPTLILTDGHKSSTTVAPSPLTLDKSSTQLSSSFPPLILRGSEPLKPSPLTLDSNPKSVPTESDQGEDATALQQKTDSAQQASQSSFAQVQKKVLVDLAGRSVVTNGQTQLLALAPTAKVATVQPLVMQNTDPSLKDQLVTEVTTLHTTRFVTAGSGGGSTLATVKSEVKTESEEDSVGGLAQQQCTMQVLLQLPTGETVPISIPATINKLQYVGGTQLQQQQPQQLQQQQQQRLQPKTSPQSGAANVAACQTTTIKQRLKAQLQSQLSPTAKATVLGENVLAAEQKAVTPTALTTFAVASAASAASSSLRDPNSPIMMLDSPGSEMNLSDSSDHSFDNKRQKMSPDSADPDERRRKFLERNRAAAARCRQKRKHWISNLEKKADELQATNSKLQNEVKLLRGEVAQLKTLLIAHKDCPVTQQQKSQGQLQHVILSDPQAQVVPTGDSSMDPSQIQVGQMVTYLQTEAILGSSHRDSLQGT